MSTALKPKPEPREWVHDGAYLDAAEGYRQAIAYANWYGSFICWRIRAEPLSVHDFIQEGMRVVGNDLHVVPKTTAHPNEWILCGDGECLNFATRVVNLGDVLEPMCRECEEARNEGIERLREERVDREPRRSRPCTSYPFKHGMGRA